MSITFTLVKEPSEGAARAIGCASDELDAIDVVDAAWLDASDFKGAIGTTAVVPGPAGAVLILVGLGPKADVDARQLRRAGAAVARAATKLSTVAIDVLGAARPEANAVACAQALAEGVVLGRYDYDALRSEKKPSALDSVEVVGKGGKRVEAAFEKGVAVANAVCVARDLVNEPGGSLTPPVFAKKAEALGAEHGFEVTVLGKGDIKKAKMGGILGVNRGSEIDPRFVELRWTPEGKSRGAVALVGKGVTFDSGGLSLKPSESMIGMKSDMGGAAAVLASFCALAAVKPKVEVRGYLPLTDNMTGGDATRLGDVLTISNGTTVEIHNTDAEGRLILADGLSKATTDEPDAIVDLATLTGACVVALGPDIAGVMGNNDAWIEQIQSAADSAGEDVWHLPLPKDLRKQLDSDIADMKNVGSRWGGALTAGLFLQEFVGEGIPWAHIDIAGPSFVDSASESTRKGGTGFAVRTLLELLAGYKKPR